MTPGLPCGWDRLEEGRHLYPATGAAGWGNSTLSNSFQVGPEGQASLPRSQTRYSHQTRYSVTLSTDLTSSSIPRDTLTSETLVRSPRLFVCYLKPVAFLGSHWQNVFQSHKMQLPLGTLGTSCRCDWSVIWASLWDRCFPALTYFPECSLEGHTGVLLSASVVARGQRQCWGSAWYSVSWSSHPVGGGVIIVCVVAFLPKGLTSLVVPAEGSEAGLESWYRT